MALAAAKTSVTAVGFVINDKCGAFDLAEGRRPRWAHAPRLRLHRGTGERLDHAEGVALGVLGVDGVANSGHGLSLADDLSARRLDRWIMSSRSPTPTQLITG